MLVSRGTSFRIRFGSPFSSKVVVCGPRLVTLSLTIYETLKWLSSLPILMQESFWWWQCSYTYVYILPLHPPPYPFPPFSPSLISLMVSVDVKHHVYLLTWSDGDLLTKRTCVNSFQRLSCVVGVWIFKLWVTSFRFWLRFVAAWQTIAFKDFNRTVVVRWN